MSRYLITGATGGLGTALIDELRSSGEAAVGWSRGTVDFYDLSLLSMALKEEAQGLPFDGVVHCAGAEVLAPLRMTSDAQYRKAMMAADSAFAILRAAASKGVMADGGSIVLMSSVAAHRGTACMAAYSAGKAAIEAMVRCAALELAPRRIRVNAVAAGAFKSPMHERILRLGGAAAYEAKHPLGFGDVDAVRDAVLHLLSDASKWTTGTTVVVDGGLLAG